VHDETFTLIRTRTLIALLDDNRDNIDLYQNLTLKNYFVTILYAVQVRNLCEDIFLNPTKILSTKK